MLYMTAAASILLTLLELISDSVGRMMGKPKNITLAAYRTCNSSH